MPLRVEPAQKDFVAEVCGIDISGPLSPDVVRAVHEAIDCYGVVVFRGQKLNDEQQMRFAEQTKPRCATCDASQQATSSYSPRPPNSLSVETARNDDRHASLAPYPPCLGRRSGCGAILWAR
jgi:alpha-ketoglutarate-dependent taurine dioxygenase